MRLLYDAVLPSSLALDAPADAEFVRWDGSDVSDVELVRESDEKGCKGVVFWGRESLQQADLRETARETGVVLVAVEADDPIDAKRRLLKNLSSLLQKLDKHHCLLVLAHEVRPVQMQQ